MVFVLSVVCFTGLTMSLATLLVIAARVLVNYGTCQLDINAGEKPLEVQGGQTLLAALYANEIFIPSACGGKGSCGHCKITVTAGGGPVLPTELSYLTRGEIRSHVRLACQVKIRENIFVKIPSDLLNVRMFDATIESATPLTHDIKGIRMRLDTPAEIVQRPGQYVQVQAPSPDGPVFRAYSISSPAYDRNAVELVVRLVPGGLGSTYLHTIRPGDRVNFTGPYGEFHLNEDPAVEIVCVGGGCGMAPMRNIIYTLYDRWPERTCWLFFGCRTKQDVFYLEQFQDLAQTHPHLHVIYALSEQDGENWSGETGFIHLSVDKYLESGVARQAFLCGPPPMIDAVTQVLTAKGLRPEDIFYDKF
ncbi:MAG: 2Fe-2S iron-sulfur cluster binding domain-containing protein [Planctomycetes bacterium]|nr:2Fe-2S iron-sulfur cluster binding domain-containing protein [Planctomycetota bacterium]